MENRPLIGVTPCYDYADQRTYITTGYIEGVIKAGGLAVLLPAADDEALLEEAVERCDGFLISGGPDLDAKSYGENNRPFNGAISPVRDRLELYVTRKAFAVNKPLFGICRGIQSMNVALGGTLFQDIYAQNPGKEMLKHQQEAPRWYPTHDINIVKGSIVWKSFGSDCVPVNSYHHQAIKELAPGFAATSWAVDGLIESVEHTSHKFAVGVQWHPEKMWHENEMYLNIFRMFVDSCRK